MTDPTSNDPPDDLDFEKSLGELERIAGDLETGDLGLEAALGQYERGVRMLRKCHEVLERAERRIELLSGLDADGKPIRQEVADVSTLQVQSVRLDPAPKPAETAPAAEPRSIRPTVADRPPEYVPSGEGDSTGEGVAEPLSAGANADRPTARKPVKKKRPDPLDESPRGKARALFADGDDLGPGRPLRSGRPNGASPPRGREDDPTADEGADFGGHDSSDAPF